MVPEDVSAEEHDVNNMPKNVNVTTEKVSAEVSQRVSNQKKQYVVPK